MSVRRMKVMGEDKLVELCHVGDSEEEALQGAGTKRSHDDADDLPRHGDASPPQVWQGKKKPRTAKDWHMVFSNMGAGCGQADVADVWRACSGDSEDEEEDHPCTQLQKKPRGCQEVRNDRAAAPPPPPPATSTNCDSEAASSTGPPPPAGR